MEKPFILFNLRGGVNHIRYHYFYGKLFPIYANIQNTFLLPFIIMLIDWSLDRTMRLPLFAYILLNTALTSSIAYLGIRLFYTKEQQNNWLAIIFVGIFNIIETNGLYSLFTWTQTRLNIDLFFGIFFLFLSVIIYGLLFLKVGRIRIYPNKISINKRVFMLEKIKRIEINTGDSEEDFPEKYLGPKLVQLTPIHFIDEYEDIEILHHFVFLEYADDLVYLIQPMTYRNHFAGNIRNAWLEDWRWEGKLKLPPEGWEKPTNK